MITASHYTVIATEGSDTLKNNWFGSAEGARLHIKNQSVKINIRWARVLDRDGNTVEDSVLPKEDALGLDDYEELEIDEESTDEDILELEPVLEPVLEKLQPDTDLFGGF